MKIAMAMLGGEVSLSFFLAACSPPAASVESTDTAALAFCHGGFSIVNVQIDPTTYHTDDPHKLLASAEGCGPRTLDITVSTEVSATNSYSGTYTPTNAQLTTALQYDISAAFTLEASSTVLVPLNAYARSAAFPAYQRATYQVVGNGCPGQMLVGNGVAMKPVGVYFETCGVIGTDSCGLACIDGRPSPDPDPGGGVDAGRDGG